MSLFGKLAKTAFDVVTTPVAIVKDAVTLGGLCTDQKKSYTVQQLKRLQRDSEEVREEVDKL